MTDLSKETTLDSISSNHKFEVKVGMKTIVKEGNSKLSTSRTYRTINPNMDWSDEDEKVQSICNALFTDAVKEEWEADQSTIK